MLEISNKNEIITIENSLKNKITLNTSDLEVKIDDMNVVAAGEFEKSGILLEVKLYSNILFYSFTNEGKHILIITNDSFDLKEEIVSFFGEVDILIIVGSKESAKIFENIEARIVIPYGEGKDIFLNTLGQHIEGVDSYKVKGELPIETTEFVNLK